MSETSHLGLPLVQPSQAQKHVTVNEAFAKLDGLTQLVLQSVSINTPPVAATDGDSYGVPNSAVNDWQGHAGEIAIWSNGGWVFSTPSVGWKAFIADTGKSAIHDGDDWVSAALAVSPNRAAAQFDVVEFDHVFGAESVSTTLVEIPQ